MRQHGLVRFMEHLDREFHDSHLKELIADRLGPNREMTVAGHEVVNFGSDSFLGLDQDPRVKAALIAGVEKWGAHNGASRAFTSVRANEEAEAKLADWLAAEDTLIYASVSLANLGALPGLVSRRDLLVLDIHAHNSMQEGARIAQANDVHVAHFHHADPDHLETVLKKAAPYRVAVVAMDGVYSMTGTLPPLAELDDVARRHNAVLYVDDAHATAVLGRQGRGTVLDALGSYDNVFAVGSLSKGFSCFGGFITCSHDMKPLLKMRSNTYLFGGPVPPAYLEAIGVVCGILSSPEYDCLQQKLYANLGRLTQGAKAGGLTVLGGSTPIISILIGDEADTLRAGRFLFDRGYFVQSVTFPAVPYHAGVLRIQANANHRVEAIDGLVAALHDMKEVFALPQPCVTLKIAS